MNVCYLELPLVGFENMEGGNIKICKLINVEDGINVVEGQFLRKE